MSHAPLATRTRVGCQLCWPHQSPGWRPVMVRGSGVSSGASAGSSSIPTRPNPPLPARRAPAVPLR